MIARPGHRKDQAIIAQSLIQLRVQRKPGVTARGGNAAVHETEAGLSTWSDGSQPSSRAQAHEEKRHER